MTFMKQGEKTKRPMLTVQVTKEHKEYLKRAAKAQGLTLSGWVLSSLNQVAESVIGQFNAYGERIDNLNTRQERTES